MTDAGEAGLGPRGPGLGSASRLTAAVVAVLLLAAALRLTGLTAWSLNNDEIAEVRWSSLSFAGMMDEVRRDAVHPPLDYVAQHLIGRMGAPEWGRRLLPALLGIATVALAIVLGSLWVSPAAGLMAGLLMSISVNHIRYSQEVRPYSMGFFFIFAALAALEMRAREPRRRWTVLWFVSVFLAGATLYFAGLIAAIASLTRIAAGRRDSLRGVWVRLPLFILGWTLLYAPWLGVVLSAARSRPPQPADTLNWPWWEHRLQVMGTGDWIHEPVSLGSWAFWAAVAIGIVASARNRRLLTATVWLIAGGAASILMLQLRPHYSSPRYLFPAWLAAFLLAGAGIAGLWSRRATRPVAAMLVLVFAGFTAVTLQGYYRGERSDWRGVAAYVYERARPGETIFLTNNWVIRNFGYYWQRLPRREAVFVERFVPTERQYVGPAWFVTGQCTPRPALASAEVMQRFPLTEIAEVRYLRPGETIPMKEELCPE